MVKENANVDASTNTETTVVSTATVQSSIANLPIAKAGEMAKTPVAVQAKFIRADFTSAKGGKTWLRIFVEGLSVPIFRTLSQASKDLGAYESADMMRYYEPLDFELAYTEFFTGKTLHFTASAHDAGAKYIVDEDSTEYTEKRAAIGEELASKTAGLRLDSFVTAVRSLEESKSLRADRMKLIAERASKVESGSVFSLGSN